VELAQAPRGRGSRPTNPNLVFGGDVHVVWEKFCRYFDVEPRIVPLQPGKYTIGPEDVEPHIDENTIGVAAVLGTTFTGPQGRHRRHQRPAGADQERARYRRPPARRRRQRRLRVAVPLPRLRVGLPPRAGPLDQRLGHKFGLVYPGIGWLIFRETADLAEDLVFEENYLGKTDATFTLNFSTGSAMVLAQYYNLVRYGRAGYTYIMKNMQQNAGCSPRSSRPWASSS
jgi:glutamate decarboxylase